LAFLFRNELISNFNNEYILTDKGEIFLSYIEQAQYPENKMW
jgi:predicted transcriptional regulator